MVDTTHQTIPRQLNLAIDDAHPRARAYGLREAHVSPLVGVRDEGGAGRIERSFRTSQARAWDYPDLGYPHSATAWAALVVDVDTPEKLKQVIYSGGALLPNWIVFNKRNGHAHACYPLARPVLEYPAANPAPLEYLADVEKKLIAALDGDPAYSAALARNPISRPRWRTETLWFRTEPWELSELDEAAASALPEGFELAAAAPGAVGRNCALFTGLMRWAGREANRFESVLMQAKLINESFSPPLPMHEVKSTAKSVRRYRDRWEARGWHSAAFRKRQSARGKASGKARREGMAERNKAIRADYDAGMSKAEIARKHELSWKQVSRILTG